LDTNSYNLRLWDKVDAKTLPLNQPFTENMLREARNGKPTIHIVFGKPIPSAWLPENFRGLKILLLAGGGGNLSPLLAATGADVTVVDSSQAQLDLDLEVCENFNLEINTQKQDMRDLKLSSEEFDLIINPSSVLYISDPSIVWEQCKRVLKKDGILITGLVNPTLYLLKEERETNIVRLNKTEDERKAQEILPPQFYEHPHSLNQSIGSLLNAGFNMTNFESGKWGDGCRIDDYIDSFISIRCIKQA
tara:strand:- start:7537 stop:8280 length:744 start_codon:yes stop_codon:yes gene_type:complete